jgi:hypothetical protein
MGDGLTGGLLVRMMRMMLLMGCLSYARLEETWDLASLSTKTLRKLKREHRTE